MAMTISGVSCIGASFLSSLSKSVNLYQNREILTALFLDSLDNFTGKTGAIFRVPAILVGPSICVRRHE